MVDHCQFLEYRSRANGVEFDRERAYCTVVDEFVQPMRADICNRRYELDPARDCEFYEEPMNERGEESLVENGSRAE